MFAWISHQPTQRTTGARAQCALVRLRGMNAHGHYNESEREPARHVEMPLPTYEEAVGTSSHHTSRRSEAHQRPETSDAHHSRADGAAGQGGGVPAGGDASSPAHRGTGRKYCAKKFLVGIVGIVLTPLLMLFILLELKTCRPCKPLIGGTNKDDQASLSKLVKCNAELKYFTEQYDELFSDLEDAKKERKKLLKKQKSEEYDMSDLSYQYNAALSDATNMLADVTRLKNEIEEYKILVKNLRNDLSSKPSSTKTTEKYSNRHVTKSGFEKNTLPENLSVEPLSETTTEMFKYSNVFKSLLDKYKMQFPENWPNKDALATSTERNIYSDAFKSWYSKNNFPLNFSTNETSPKILAESNNFGDVFRSINSL